MLLEAPYTVCLLYIDVTSSQGHLDDPQDAKKRRMAALHEMCMLALQAWKYAWSLNARMHLVCRYQGMKNAMGLKASEVILYACLG